MRRRLACLALVFAAGCLEVEPPAGQFFCATPADCPDGWVCGSDALCYPEPLACYPYDQTSCPAGEGCYPLGGGAGTICWPAGPVAENAPCDDSMQATRCGIGFRCVSRADGVGRCSRLCRSDADCGVLECNNFLADEDLVAMAGRIGVCTYE